ncbi:MAG: phage tail tube protein, partial [Culicoidibacterales bacterium]
MGNKIDSNVVGLAYAEETSLKVLPGTGGVDAIWRPLDPNEYGDFGADIKTIARNPISADRQRKKGVVSDLDASGSIVQDVTQNNLTRLMQGFF